MESAAPIPRSCAVLPKAGDLLMVANVGWNPGVVGHTTLGTDLASPSGQTFQTRQTVVLDDAPRDPEFRYSPLLRDHGILSLLNVPISVDGIAAAGAAWP